MKKILKNSIRRASAVIMATLLASAVFLSSCSSGSPIANDYPYDLDEYISTEDLTSVKVSASEVENEVEYRVVEFLWENDLAERLYDTQARQYDKVVIDYTCFIDGLPIDAFGKTGATAYIGKGDFVDGIEEGIIGMSIGDVKEITVTYPETYYEGLENKEAIYRVTLNEIHRPKELNDSMCKAYTDYTTVESLRDAFKRSVASEMAWSQLLASAEMLQYPSAEYSKIYDSLMSIKEYAEKREMTLEDFLSQYGDGFSEFGISSDMTEAEFFEACDKYTKDRLKEEILMYHLLRKLETPTKGKAYNEMCAKLLREMNCDSADNYDERYGVGAFEYDVLYNLMLDALYGHIELV